MKIAISLEHGMHIAGVSAYESALMVKKAGFDGVDVSMCHDQLDPEKMLAPAWLDKILEEGDALKRAGLEASQCHMPYYPGHIDLPGNGDYADFEAFMLPGYRRAIEACGAIGCKVAVLHPFFTLSSAKGTREGNLRTIEKLMPDLEKYGVKLALENVYGLAYSDSHVSRAEDLLAIVDKANSPLVGVCIDTGHANIFRLNIADMARACGKKLFALHINGNAGKDEHVIPMSMSGWCEKMDYHAFSAALKEIGFSGAYNLEIASGDLPASVAQPFYNYAAAVARAMADEAE